MDAVESSTGTGVRGNVGGKALALGNSALMTQLGIAVEVLEARGEALRARGGLHDHAAVDRISP